MHLRTGTWTSASIMMVHLLMFACDTTEPGVDGPIHPYGPGDTLVFTSSDGQVDIRVITGTDRCEQVHHGRPEQLAVVMCTDSCSLRYEGLWNTFIVGRTTPRNGPDILSLNICCGHAFTYGFLGTRIIALDSLPERSVIVADGRTVNARVIEPDTMSDEYLNNTLDPRAIRRIYWNRSMGIVRYDMRNSGVTWTLSRYTKTSRSSGT